MRAVAGGLVMEALPVQADLTSGAVLAAGGVII